MPKSEPDIFVDPELIKISDTLNQFLKYFPLKFKRKLTSHVKSVRNALTEILTKEVPTETAVAAQKVHDISETIKLFFDDLTRGYGSSLYNCLEEEDSILFIVLLEKYWSTFFYAQLFNLVQVSTNDNQLDNLIARYGPEICPEHFNIYLNLENPDVRDCVYLAIRELAQIPLLKSAHEKLDCIYKSCLFVMTALSKSLDGRPVAADEFLPGLIYVVMKAKVPNFWTHITFVSKFIGVEKTLESGERAYYFTTLDGACRVISGGFGGRPPDLNSEFTAKSGQPCFLESVEIIHKECQAVYSAGAAELVRQLKEAKEILDKVLSDQKEKKYWNVIKWIPAINIAYGSIRGVVYSFKGNKTEAVNSVIGAVGGAAGLAVGIGGAFIGGPVITPVVASLVGGGAANQTVTGGGEMAVESYNNPDWFRSLTHDEREKQIYERVLKDIPLLGFGYSVIRAPTYLIKRNTTEAKRSGINALVNAGASAAGIAAGVGAARLARALPASSVASSIADGADDVAKPLASEVIEFVTDQAIRFASSQSTHTVVRGGVCNLARIIVEENISQSGDGVTVF